MVLIIIPFKPITLIDLMLVSNFGHAVSVSFPFSVSIIRIIYNRNLEQDWTLQSASQLRYGPQWLFMVLCKNSNKFYTTFIRSFILITYVSLNYFVYVLYLYTNTYLKIKYNNKKLYYKHINCQLNVLWLVHTHVIYTEFNNITFQFKTLKNM